MAEKRGNSWDEIPSISEARKASKALDIMVGRHLRGNSASSLLRRGAGLNRAGMQYDGKRDVYSILGYKKELTFHDFYAKYERQDIASRIVDMPPDETWRRNPVLTAVDNEDGSEDEFFKAWRSFALKNRVYHYLRRIDIASGIGQFGVLMLGFSDINDISDLEKSVNNSSDLELMYMQVFHEGDIDIAKWDNDITSPRYGLPEIYRLKFRNYLDGSLKGSKTQDIRVHWERCIHVAEGVLDHEIFGRSRLAKVYNLLDDTLKVAGGSAEMFWQNVATTWQMNIEHDSVFEDEDLELLEEKFYESLHGIRRLIQTSGAKLEPMGGDTPDPRGVFSVEKALIASTAQIPQRILFGAEEGELASTQDTAEWYGRIEARQARYVEPMILREFINRMARVGLIILPEGEYRVEWPTLFVQSETDKAKRALDIATALGKYSPRAAHLVVSPAEMREVIGLPKKKQDDDLVEEINDFIKEMEELSHSDAGREASTTTERDANLEA